MVQRTRRDRLFPNAVPRYVRVYDNGGKTFDRFTVVFTGPYRKRTLGDFVYIGTSEHPFHPQGFGQHGSSREQIDRPSSSHLGKRIAFVDLPCDVQTFAAATYKDLWNL